MWSDYQGFRFVFLLSCSAIQKPVCVMLSHCLFPVAGVNASSLSCFISVRRMRVLFILFYLSQTRVLSVSCSSSFKCQCVSLSCSV